MAFHRVSGHAICVDSSNHVHRPTVADALELSRGIGIGGSHRTMVVPRHGSAEPSGLPGDSSTWAVGCPWTLPLGEASHVYQCVGDHAGMDG